MPGLPTFLINDEYPGVAGGTLQRFFSMTCEVFEIPIAIIATRQPHILTWPQVVYYHYTNVCLKFFVESKYEL